MCSFDANEVEDEDGEKAKTTNDENDDIAFFFVTEQSTCGEGETWTQKKRDGDC